MSGFHETLEEVVDERRARCRRRQRLDRAAADRVLGERPAGRTLRTLRMSEALAADLDPDSHERRVLRHWAERAGRPERRAFPPAIEQPARAGLASHQS